MSDLSPEAEELLKRASDSFSPDAAKIASLRAALASKLGPSPSSPGPGGAASSLAGGGTGAKLALAGVLVFASAIGAQTLLGRPLGETRSTSTSSGSPLPVAFPQPLIEPVPSGGAPAIPVGAPPSAGPEPVVAHRALPSVAVPSLSPSTPSRRRSGGEPRPVVMTEAPASTTAAAVATSLASTSPASTAPAAMATAPASTAPVVTAEPVDTALGGEVSFLRAAHLALDHGDPARAVGLLDRYAEAYPRGTLEEESLATRALSLCALARVAAARDVARRLERLAPRSPYLARVHASCAGSENETK